MWTFKDFRDNWITWYSQREYSKLERELKELKKKYKKFIGETEDVV